MHKIVITVLVFLALFSAGGVSADSQAPMELQSLSVEDARSFFPDVRNLADATDNIPARPVFGSKGLIGYLFITIEITPIPAYSGKPVSLLVGMAPNGEIKGAKILHHEEPILVVGVKEQKLQEFIDQYRGLNAEQNVRVGAYGRPGYTGIDGITGATITAMVINHSIMRSARKVFEEVQQAALQKETPLPTPERLKEGGGTGTPSVVSIRDLLRDNILTIVLLGSALLLLLGILFFQDWLVKRPRLFNYVRTGYLLFTVFYIGFYLHAQLSAFNLLAFAQRLGEEIFWEPLFYDIAIFMLWAFVACTILLWGRGVFCGWLCPFGALQELIFGVARKLGLPQFTLPALVHERLWAIKYILLIMLIGVSLDSMVRVAPLLEVEPFKTTFGMLFQREFIYVVYALGLLVISAFNSKFYCKYLCVLGAGLSIFSRFHVFGWLRRRTECGHPCQICAQACPIDAIKPTGEIIDSECHYCLRCQVLYWDDHVCPPLVEKRKKMEWRLQKNLLQQIIDTTEVR